MKRILLTIVGLTLFVGMVDAQSDPLRDKLNLVFANINKSQVPTGFLEEFGVHLVPLDVFQGTLTDSNKVNIYAWRQVYATLQSARIYGTNPLSELGTVNATIETTETNSAGSLPVTMLYTDYNYLRPDAISLNLFTIQNNQLYDVAGRTQSPYLSRKLFAASPTIGFADNGTPSLVFHPSLFYNVTNKVVSTIQVDFNDGRGYLFAVWNNPIAASYTSKGVKQIKIKVTFTDSSEVKCYSFLEITDVSSAQARYSGAPDISHDFWPSALHSGGKAHVKYSAINPNSPKRIRKPLIVVEGYDISKIAPLLQNNFKFSDFYNLINNTLPYDLNYQLDNIAGYDLIFLDFNNGTDDIRRNAALLKEVISWTNTQKAGVSGNQPNVLLGISMGGLVARYALADMTKQGVNTQTRLLLTHDSPHRGANTPLGFQALTRGINEVAIVQTLKIFNLLPELTQAVRVLDAPATTQMLIVRALSGTGSYAMNSFLDNEYRSMVTFGSSGPQPTYKVEAVSLGAECGNGNNLQPYAELLRINGNFNISPLPWISRTGWNTEVIVNALPATGQSRRISKLRLWVNFKILIFISVDLDLTNKEFYSPSTLLPWDGAPGGTQNTALQIGTRVPSVNYSFFPFFSLQLGATYYPGDFCFVPTVSALDATSISQSSLNLAYAGGVSATNPARVANFIANKRATRSSVFNESHPRFTARNAEWMYLEMESPTGNMLNCPAECVVDYGAAIISVGPLCYGVPQNVGLSGIFPSSATFTWTASPAGMFAISSGSGKIANLTILDSNVSGSVQITFKVLGLCQPLLSVST